jgi:tripartite-type tricarboxylate transporter receptor subunit TctC
VIESGVPNFDVLGWYGLVFPAGVPDAIVQKTSKALNEVLARDSVKKQLDNVGAIAVSSTPAEFGKMIADEIARWREVASTAGLQPQ